jgi:echinoderm microtubule-associated protein-like 6
LASVGIDVGNTIKIWNWRRGKVLSSVNGHSERVFDIAFHGEQVITCGVKHIRFWTLLGNTLQFSDGRFGKSEAQTLLCIGHFAGSTRNETNANANANASSDDNDDLCFTGAIDGDVYVWRKNKIDRIVSAHQVG